MDAVTSPPAPVNEPVRHYPAGSPERAALAGRLRQMISEGPVELLQTLGGVLRPGGGSPFVVVRPDRRHCTLGTFRASTEADVLAAVEAARVAAPAWRDLPFDERAAVLLKAADLLSGPWRDTLNAATMLGQSKSCYQAEIDAACELADFWRFNVAFARQVLAEQPASAPGSWNRNDHRPLEGFVLAITPFNFTAIAGNLPMAPALMGNTVVWKPAPSQQLAAHYTLRLLEAAGLPAGVVNMVLGDGAAVSAAALPHRDLAGVHFTGSTATFQGLWRRVAAELAGYRSYPRLVGETGGKDFVVAHPSAEPDRLVAALVRGAFDYQGQKCSAASRAYLPRSLWQAGLRDALVAATEDISYGDVTDFANFGGALIDRRAYERLSAVLQAVRSDPSLTVLAGGSLDDTEGFFMRPTVLLGDDPGHEVFTREFFGPLLSVYVYPDADYEDVLAQAADAAPYALTGALFARDRQVVERSLAALRFAAGNIYVNDKPTGAVVGQQPFGGGRASGTNDKAGSILNLLRWTSPRVIKESFLSPTGWRYPHQA